MRKGQRKRGDAGHVIDGCTLGTVGKYRVAYYVENGRRLRARLGKFRSETQALDALKRFAEARAALIRARDVPTIGALWSMWLKHREDDGFSNAIYAAIWVSLQPHFGHRRPETITDTICREYARGRFALGRSSWTVNTELARLRTCLQWAESRWHIPRAPYVWVPSRGKGRKLVITAEEAKKLIEAAIAPHLRLFIILALTTGARHTAILDLTWDRVDFDAGVISYDEDLEVDPMSKSWRKGRASVPMNALSRAALELSYRGRLTDQVIEYHGKRLKSVREGFADVVARAGLSDKITPHTIRHSVATWLRERGVELKRISEVLGHADMRTTDLIYTHTGTGFLIDAVTQLDDTLGGKK